MTIADFCRVEPSEQRPFTDAGHLDPLLNDFDRSLRQARYPTISKRIILRPRDADRTGAQIDVFDFHPGKLSAAA